MKLQSVVRIRRSAFTLVEMLVASALIIFMMYILATAFQAGLESFRTLKIAGDMQEKLRAASTLIRTDLCRPHFDGGSTPEEANLSGQRLDQEGWLPPQAGYFRIYQGLSATGNRQATEGLDPDDVTVSVGRNTEHTMQFTVRLDSRRPTDFFAANLAGNQLNPFSTPDFNRSNSYYTTQLAEVSYFLAPYNPPLYTDATLTVQRYGLCRRVQLVVDTPEDLSGVNALQIDPAGRISKFNATFNRGQDVTAPIRRFQPNKVPNKALPASYDPMVDTPIRLVDRPSILEMVAASTQVEGEVLLPDVTCFEIKAMYDVPTSTKMKPVKSERKFQNADYPFNFLPDANTTPGKNPKLQAYRVFDTWSRGNSSPGSPVRYQYGGLYPDDPDRANWNMGHFVGGSAANDYTVPLRIRIRSLQIRIRIWDVKSQQSRQITVVQDV